MGKIIITGVDGNFGGHAARTILEKVKKGDLIFTSPNKAVVDKFVSQGIDARYADYTDPAQLISAFAGGETLLLISVPQVGEKRRLMHKNAIDAAVSAGVKRIVYTSIVGAGVPENDAYEIADHKYTEAYILGSGLKYVILRDAQYCEAMVAAFMQAADSGGVLSNNMGDGRMAHVARNDCAEAAACAAAGAGCDNAVYYITGPSANTMEEFVAIGSEVTGKKVAYHYITDEEMWAFFDSKFVPRKTDGDWSKADPAFPFCSDGMVTFGRAIRLDHMSNCTNDFELLTGKKPKSVCDVFSDLEHHQIGGRTATD
jgi:NAD(P)H dehydrogenase (quinone)